MNVFVWKRIKNCSDNYHSEGGVVVFAETLNRAKALAAAEGCTFADGEEPDEVRAVAGGEEKVFIMPDAGCC